MGAVLSQIGQAHPEARLSGIDLNPEQIATVRGHPAGQGLEAVELVVGDAAQLPWPNHWLDRIRRLRQPARDAARSGDQGHTHPSLIRRGI